MYVSDLLSGCKINARKIKDVGAESGRNNQAFILLQVMGLNDIAGYIYSCMYMYVICQYIFRYFAGTRKNENVLVIGSIGHPADVSLHGLHKNECIAHSIPSEFLEFNQPLSTSSRVPCRSSGQPAMCDLHDVSRSSNKRSFTVTQFTVPSSSSYKCTK